MRKMTTHFNSLFIIALLSMTAIAFCQTPDYKATDFIKIDTAGRWDYLSIDESMHRLYVSHDSEVDVVNLENDSLIGRISNLKGVHGIAFAAEFEKGFISNGKDNSVTVFNLKTLEVIANVKITGKKPDAIVYEPFNKRIFTFNGGSSNATAIDAKTNKVVGTVTLDGAPEFAASDLNGKMYVNLEEENAVNVFDPLTFKVIAKWPLAPCATPTGMSIDVKRNRLFVSGGNKTLAVVDINSGKVIATLPIGGKVDACAFDKTSNLVFTSNGDGTLTVIQQESLDSYKVIQNVTTLKGARTMAIDQMTHIIYATALKESDKDAKTKSVTKSFGVLKIESK